MHAKQFESQFESQTFTQHTTLRSATPLLDVIATKRSLLELCADAEPQEVAKPVRKILCPYCGDPSCYLSREE
jgi:hypothetical protein